MKKILFVCMLNAARSQAAEALFKYYMRQSSSPEASKWVAESAGMMSKQNLNPYVVEILAKRGISMEGQFSKKIDFTKLKEYDKVISFVPFPKGGLHDDTKAKIKLWEISDPLGRPFETTEEIVAEIDERVRGLVRELTTVQ